MSTLSSCLIWQIISFILPANEYGCVYAGTKLENIARLHFTILATKKIIFSEENHLDLCKYVNKQNYRIWGTENPHEYIEKPTHPKRVTVWCGFWSRGIIGQFFFENKQGESMLNEIFFTKIKEEDIGNICFQQDGTTCHTAEATLDVLRPVFQDCIISRRADAVWPPRSCKLTPLDYYFSNLFQR